MNLARSALWVTIAVASIGIASGQTVYKLIDKNGKVTYAESPPKYFDGQVIRIDVDPNANKATLTSPSAGGELGGKSATEALKADLRKAQTKREQAQVRAAELRAELDGAKKELEEARTNPGPENITQLGKVGKGSRPVLTEAYQERLALMEKNVKQLETQLQEAERDAR